MGHELTHGFDDQGQQYDKDGNLKRWWDPTSINHFKDRQTCFRNQYSAYELYSLHVNGNLTLGENLAEMEVSRLATRPIKLCQELMHNFIFLI